MTSKFYSDLDLNKDSLLFSQGFIHYSNFNPGQFGMTQPQGTQWLGYTQCDICHEECEEHLYDAKTSDGSWAVMCTSCWRVHGNPGLLLGLGFGQKYERREHNYYFKIEG